MLDRQALETAWNELQSEDRDVVRGARERLEKIFREGETEAALMLGHAYLNGVGFEKSPVLALVWFQRAFLQSGGGPRAALAISDYYVSAGDGHEALHFLSKAAATAGDDETTQEAKKEAKERSDELRQMMLDQGQPYDPDKYLQSLLGDSDPARAIPALERRAADGDAEAALRLVRAFDVGWGGTMDPVRAVHFLELAAKAEPKIGFAVGELYIYGVVDGKGYRDAVDLVYPALRAQWPRAMFALGSMWFNRFGPFSDPESTIGFLAQAASQGHAQSQYDLACLLQSAAQSATPRPDLAKRVAELFVAAAEQGHGDAQYSAALCYVTGSGVAPDREKAHRYLHLAEAQGIEAAIKTVEMNKQRGGGSCC